MANPEETYAPAREHEDAAWLRIETPLPTADLRTFLDDVERLYRINPLLEILTFEPAGPSRYRLVAHNLSNDSNVDVVLAATPAESGLDVVYDRGLKVASRFRVEARPGGSLLYIVDVYGGGTDDQRRSRKAEVDLSLNAWGRGLYAYLGQWARWRRLAPWRWYMRRVWQPLTPSARRIVWMIWVISAVEAVAAGLVLAVWLVVRSGT